MPDGRDNALGERGWRVFEDTRAEKWRRDPDGSERRNVFKMTRRLKSNKKRRRGRFFVLPTRNEGDRALMAGGGGIRVETRMQAR